MKPRRGHKAAVRRPYITTTELLDISGISRKTLRGYESHGIIEPAYEENDYYKYWTLEQIEDIFTINDLARSSTLSLDEIALEANASNERLVETAYEHMAADMRRTRRSLRRISQTRRVLRDFAGIEKSDRYYLRYLPDRWHALIPLTPHCTEFSGSSLYIEACQKLLKIVDIVGWSPSATFGTIISRDLCNDTGSRYLFLSLTAGPAPRPSSSLSIDCGCYQAFDPKGQCSQGSCIECSRFGRNPKDKEIEEWERETERALKMGEDPQLRTVFTKNLKEPYPTGCWSLYTRRHLGDPDATRDNMKHGPSLCPRLMPHEVSLPYGVTACHVPGGHYLCRQADSSHRDEIYAQMLKDVAILDTYEITRDKELEAFRQANSAAIVEPLHKDQQDAFRKEPFTNIAGADDQRFQGWSTSLTDEEFASLKLKINTALQPENGFLIISERTPLGRKAEEIVHELQIAVEPSGELLAKAGHY